MKRRIILSIALTLSSTLLLLTNSDSTVKAQNQIRVVADTGMITLGPNQKLRLSIFDDTDGAEKISFRRTVYAPGVCSGGICKHTASPPITSPVITLQPGESALYDLIDPQGQVKVLSNSRRTKVTAMIIDTVTGEIVTQIIMANTEGDFH